MNSEGEGVMILLALVVARGLGDRRFGGRPFGDRRLRETIDGLVIEIWRRHRHGREDRFLPGRECHQMRRLDQIELAVRPTRSRLRGSSRRVPARGAGPWRDRRP